MKKYIAGAITGAILAACSPSPGSIYEKGREAMLARDYDTAIELLSQIGSDTTVHNDLRCKALSDIYECYAAKNDSAAAMESLKQAALAGHREARRAYMDFLEANPQPAERYIGFYESMNRIAPHYGLYAARLAKGYLFVKQPAAPAMAAQYLTAFVNKSGSTNGSPDMPEKMMAAYMLAKGLGGYAYSPEGAARLAEGCRSHFSRNSHDDTMQELEQHTIDADALVILGNLELASTFDPDNVRRALAYYKGARAYGHTLTCDAATLDAAVAIIESYLMEREKVNVNSWWPEPGDWKRYTNDSGFGYIGHTAGNGPSGTGYGVWNNGRAFVGTWKGHNEHKGILVDNGTLCIK
ncbi:MAG: hypothetical protein K2L74_09560 [Muribaculaceae bacterium]|nr:hypothetical protein [Muribaculaceae bacterium]